MTYNVFGGTLSITQSIRCVHVELAVCLCSGASLVTLFTSYTVRVCQASRATS